jgi:hypothetical protein
LSAFQNPIRNNNQDATGAGPRGSKGNTQQHASEGNEPLGSISRQSQQGQRKLH